MNLNFEHCTLLPALFCDVHDPILANNYIFILLQREPGAWKYVGGDTFLESVPVSWKYADLVFSLAEKVDGAISLKYQLPGEDLDPDGLISVADDSDIAVSFIFPQQFLFLGNLFFLITSSHAVPSNSHKFIFNNI